MQYASVIASCDRRYVRPEFLWIAAATRAIDANVEHCSLADDF
jgi:hypothetical protein